MPVIYNEQIKGLRIHLEEKYKLATTDIWFSSSNEYQGSSAKNNIMIFIPENERRIGVYDLNKVPRKDIVITSDILMGYRLFNRDKKITIAVPNKITKRQSQEILNRLEISNADIYLDEHTIVYDYRSLYRNLLCNIDENKQNFNYILDYKSLIIKNDEDVNISNVA